MMKNMPENSVHECFDVRASLSESDMPRKLSKFGVIQGLSEDAEDHQRQAKAEISAGVLRPADGGIGDGHGQRRARNATSKPGSSTGRRPRRA